MAFYVGQKVVTIVKWERQDHLSGGVPEKGSVYTVRGFVYENGRTGLYLNEITNPPLPVLLREPAFESQFFRPAVEPDIQQFRDLVAPIFNGQRAKELVT